MSGRALRAARHAQRLDVVAQLRGDRVEPMRDPLLDVADDRAVGAVIRAVPLVVQGEGFGDEP